MPLGYPNDHVRKVSENPYGASRFASSRNTSDTSHIQAVFSQGVRLAQVAAACRPNNEPSALAMSSKIA